MWKKIVWLLLLILIAFLLLNWEWVAYGYFQARGQLKVITEARPVDDFLEDPDFPDSLKHKLLLTKEVRKFAIDSLGLNSSNNYTKLYDQQGKSLLWNVSASEAYALKAYEWSYPFLGKMPYKGFFELGKAKVEARKLKEQGYDVRIRTVNGWSTLGILQDPLLSNMLKRNEGALAEVIIHELTHATLFVKNEIEFNENLASFIGVKGAETFLKTHFGDSSTQLMEYIHSQQDEKTFTALILNGARTLEDVYSSFDDRMNPLIKDSLKAEVMLNIKKKLDSTSFHNLRYQNIFNNVTPNNAYFVMFRRYHNQEDSLQRIFKDYGENIQQMLMGMKEHYGK